ncbi:MAG: hypothetical protein KAT27_02985 [Desulfobacterales bacterium]|nr:hypothetical protein [Desulfobacterales bacterium]
MTETIRVREDVVTLRSDRPKHLGTKIDLEVKLPEGVLLQSFTLNGTITSCEYVSDNGSGSYILEVKIGDISPMNKKILKAYIDFLEREDMLKGIEMDLKALQQAFSHFGQRLSQLRATSELMRSELEGILELLMRNPGRKITIH